MVMQSGEKKGYLNGNYRKNPQISQQHKVGGEEQKAMRRFGWVLVPKVLKISVRAKEKIKIRTVNYFYLFYKR